MTDSNLICDHHNLNDDDKCAHIAWHEVRTTYEDRRYTLNLCKYHTLELVRTQMPDADSIKIYAIS